MSKNKVDDYIKYTCEGYRYEPASFRAYKVYINRNGGKHKYLEMPLTAAQRSKIGYARIGKGEAAAAALAKRYDREIMRMPRRLFTYGFLDADNASRYYFTRQLRCEPDTPIAKRLHIFRTIRDTFSHGLKIKRSEMFLDAYRRPVGLKNKTIYDRENADLTKPVIVNLIIPDWEKGA